MLREPRRKSDNSTLVEHMREIARAQDMMRGEEAYAAPLLADLSANDVQVVGRFADRLKLLAERNTRRKVLEHTEEPIENPHHPGCDVSSESRPAAH